MDELASYARDLAAEVRRMPSVLMVVLALLLFALSASSEMVTDARTAVVAELHELWAASSAPSSGGHDPKTMLRIFGDASLDDVELQ